MSISINSKKYKIIKELGQGGNGKVYLALNKKDNKYYAIKKISIEDLTKEEISIIENEAKILSSIHNEHIVRYYDSYKDKEYFYILMEYCEGSDLKKFINEYKKKNKTINEDIISTIVYEIYLGIKEIHDKNLIHRDLKPENLFISNDNRIKIGDFGISKQLDLNNKYATTSIGTNNYIAPEVVQGKNYNNKVDIWAFGCIIYELLTLNVCFQSKSLFGFVDMIINKSHGTINKEIYNPKWQDLIDLLLEKDYKKRPDINEIYNLIMELYCVKKSSLEMKRINKEELNIEKRAKKHLFIRSKNNF